MPSRRRKEMFRRSYLNLLPLRRLGFNGQLFLRESPSKRDQSPLRHPRRE
jgi:hypothetical protein